MFIFKIPKMIFIGIIIFMVILAISIKIGVTLPKDEILNVYDSIIQTFSSKGLSKDKDLKGERNFGVDEYVGTYKAKYDNYTGTETVFGGTYTMDFKEAAQLINEIQPKIAIPIHYGSVVGTNQDATDFVKLLNPSIKGIILMKQ